jgi:hypothetical protein
MKRMPVFLIIAGVVSFAMWPVVIKAENTDEDDQQIQKLSKMSEKERSIPDDNQAVIKRLKDQYGVDDQRIKSLRKKNLGYGEIDIVFSLAEQMPGKINDENVEKIMGLRQSDQGTIGWGKVARQLGVKLGDIKGQVEKVGKSNLEDMKNKLNGVGKSSRMEAAPRGNTRRGFENPAKSARPGKLERFHSPNSRP